MSAAAQPVPHSKSARRGVYYGWASVAVAALAMVGTLPGRTQGLGLITEPLLVDLQIDRVTYATINLWATSNGSLFCLPCGRLVDRLGSRIVLTIVIAALAATVLGMSTTSGAIALGAAITLSRGFGQSALSVASLALVGKWFGRGLRLCDGSLLAAGWDRIHCRVPERWKCCACVWVAHSLVRRGLGIAPGRDADCLAGGTQWAGGPWRAVRWRRDEGRFGRR